MKQLICTKITTSSVLLTIAIAVAFLIGAFACHYTQMDSGSDDATVLETAVASNVR